MPLELFHNIYRGKKVLITGHTGFKGSWLAIWLRELGAEVIGYSLDPYTSEDNFVRTKLGEKISDIRGDINDLVHISKVFEESQPEFVFHLAAQPIVRESYDHPLDTFETNTIGTAKVLEAIRQTPSVKATVLITTDKVYQNTNSMWGYRECDPLGGYDPYSASKVCAEIIIDSYRKSFFSTNQDKSVPAIASARAGNVIGGGDWQKDRLIPDCIRALSKHKPINIRNPTAIRPWQHVIEALVGYLLLGEKLLTVQDTASTIAFAGAWNFGPLPDSCYTVEKVVKKLVEIWKAGTWETDPPCHEEKHEAQILLLDITKATQKLGWQPFLTFDETLEFTINWYKYALENATEDLYDFCKEQINAYCELSQKRKNKD